MNDRILRDLRDCVEILNRPDPPRPRSSDNFIRQHGPALEALLRERDEMVSALVDLDEAYCDVHPDMTKEARAFGRKALITARQIVAKAKGPKP